MSSLEKNDSAIQTVFEGHEVQLLIINDEPWWIAKDVCGVLDISDVSQAVSRLDEDEKLMRTLHVSGQNREAWLVNEFGLYSLILTSRKPEAKKFKRWVTHEVIPSIRKRGVYVAPNAVSSDVVQDSLLQGLNTLTNSEKQLNIITTKLLEYFSEDHKIIQAHDQKLNDIEEKLVNVPSIDDGVCVAGYFSRYKIDGDALRINNAVGKRYKTMDSFFAAIGNRVCKLCRDDAVTPQEMNHPKYGKVNIYPPKYIKKVVDMYLGKDSSNN